MDDIRFIFGSTVTQRIGQVKQPRGGYLRPKDFNFTQLDGGGIDDLNPKENISPALVGMTVDYLTRYATGTDPRQAFAIPGRGAHVLHEEDTYESLLTQIDGLSDTSITAACKLAGFDSAFRAGPLAYRPVDEIQPDKPTIGNIRTMVGRSTDFFKQYGPKTLDGLTFDGGYTPTVCAGDGDFMTADTLWEFKVSKNKPTAKWTLQLLMYWRMGLHSKYADEYRRVRYLGIFNPRLNNVYRLDAGSIPAETVEKVETEIIGY